MQASPTQPRFNRPPRIIRQLPRDEIEIPAPPQPPNAVMAQSLAMVILPTLTGVFYLIVVIARGSQDGSLWFSLPIILISFVSAGVGLRNYREQQRRLAEEKQKYNDNCSEAVKRIKSRLKDLTEKQKTIYDHNFPSPEKVIGIVKLDSFDTLPEQRLWERRIDDDDFLHLRIGLGNLPTSLKIKAPKVNEFQFSDQLREIIELVDQYSTVKNVPIVLPLPRVGSVGVSAHSDQQRIQFVYWLIWQIAVHHAPQDVRLAAFWKCTDDLNWSWLRWLPHTRSFDDESYRLLARYDGDPEDLKQVAAVLQRELQQRLEYGLQHQTRIVVVFDRYEEFATQFEILNAIIENGPKAGIFSICLVPEARLTPSVAGSYIDLDKKCLAIAGENGGETHFAIDKLGDASKCDALARKLASLSDQMKVASRELPRSVRFSELLKLGDLQQFDPKKVWQDPPDDKSWNKVEVGLASPDEPLYIDLNEGIHGVHGIIAGTTGSGKSEFMLTFLMALAVRHSPDRLNLLLIDFKGGATFKDIANLPHTVGMVTDLSGNEAERALIAINSELDRRKRRLQEVGATNIREYRRLQQRHPSWKSIPNLMIAIDEFDEMMRDFPYFGEELVRVAKQGRSLGVHLLFATQQPSAVKEGLTRNLTYRIALRVTSPDDSKTLLGISDAAYLTTATPGRGFFRVNKDVRMFQSARITLPYILHNNELIEVDATGRYRVSDQFVERFVNDLAGQLNQAVDQVKLRQLVNYRFRELTHRDLSEQDWQRFFDRLLQARDPKELRIAARALIDLMQRDADTELVLITKGMQRVYPASYAAENYRVWLEPLPALLPLGQLQREGSVKVPIGLLDYPEQAKQQPLSYDPFGANSNVLVVGAARSGKTTALRTLMLSLASAYSPEQLWIYVIDQTGLGCGLKGVDNESLPHLADAFSFQDDMRLERLIVELEAIVDERRSLFRNVRVDNLDAYRQLCHDNPIPIILLVIDEVSGLSEEYTNALVDLLREARPYGVVAAVSGGTHKEVRLWLNVCELRLVLRLSNNEDSEVLLGKKVAATIPANLPGRGFMHEPGGLVEVQMALPVLENVQLVSDAETFVDLLAEARKLVKDIRQQYAGMMVPNPLRLPPDYLRYSDLQLLLSKTQSDDGIQIPFALSTRELQPVWFDLHDLREMPTLIAGGPRSGKSTAARTLLTAIAARSQPEDTQFVLIDYRRETLAPFVGSDFVKRWQIQVADPVPFMPQDPANWKGTPEEIAMAVWEGHVAGLCIELWKELRDRAVSQRKLPRLILVINDFDLLKDDNNLMNYLARLASYVMRDVGFHMILVGTDFPTNSLTRVLSVQRCALYLGKPSDPSSDNPNLANIGVKWSKRWAKAPFPPGRGLLRLPDKQAMVQVGYPSNEDIKHYVHRKDTLVER